MNQELELKLQACVDGELSGRETQKLLAETSANAEAQALLAELKMTSIMLAGHEPEARVPESREFYWSKIRREIEIRERAATRAPGGTLVFLRRFLAPAAGVALVAFLGFAAIKFYSSSATQHLAEVENLSEDVTSYSFRASSEKMFVVWVSDRTQDGEAEPEAADETVVQ